MQQCGLEPLGFLRCAFDSRCGPWAAGAGRGQPVRAVGSRCGPWAAGAGRGQPVRAVGGRCGRQKKYRARPTPEFSPGQKKRPTRTSRKNAAQEKLPSRRETYPGYSLPIDYFCNQDPRPGVDLPIIFKFQTPSARPWQLACPKGRTHRPFMPHHQTTHHPPTNLLRRTKAQSNLDQLDDLRKMCDTINDELGRLATALNHRHGAPQQRWRPWST